MKIMVTGAGGFVGSRLAGPIMGKNTTCGA